MFPSRYSLLSSLHFCCPSDACLHALLDIMSSEHNQSSAIEQLAREVGNQPLVWPFDNFLTKQWLRQTGRAYEVDLPLPEESEPRHHSFHCLH
jgi:hypothetical protein